MEGIVTKKNANLFTVLSDGRSYIVSGKGTLKKQGVFVGDKVEFDKTIEKVMPRKNLLIRPPLANLDRLFIVIAPLPKPDFVLVDKMMVYCFVNGIEPILVVNKTDIASDDFICETRKNYKNACKIIEISTKNANFDELKKEIQGTCALAGQSAVGKSSIMNVLLGKAVCEIGNLSAKVQRGKQTTRLVELFAFEKGYLADTAGFSMLELTMVSDLSPRELSTYYPDFLKARQNCKFSSCLHQKHDKCGIIESVKNGEISKMRYLNYLKILQELQQFKKY